MRETAHWRDQLVRQVEVLIAESGDPEHVQGFDAGVWLDAFLACPHPALGGRRPDAFMDTAEGRVRIRQLIAMMQSGAYA